MVVRTELYARVGFSLIESSTCWTGPEPFPQSTFMIRSSASVKVPDCLGGTEGPPWHLRRFTQRKVTNSLVAGEMSRVARLAHRTRPHQDVALRLDRAKCEWQRPPVRRVEAGAQLPAQDCCP